ncbi:MAG TPA: MGMT family protein [bacterium]|nr:MGMT family protein [bacterium]
MNTKNTIKKVFAQVNRIKFGNTSTYKHIAIKCNGISPRTVGKILGQNKNLIAIPCHRIICSSGDPGGYKLGREFKKFVLEWERNIIFQKQLNR